MANTAIRKLQAGTPTGGTAGQALVKNSGTDFDYDWGTGGSVVVTNVSIIEDFLFSTQVIEGGVGTDVDYREFSYSYWYTNADPGSQMVSVFSEQNHAGIIEFDGVLVNDERLIAFSNQAGGATPTDGGIPVDNDFEVEILTRNTYNVSANTHEARYHLISASETLDVTVNADSVNNNISYTLFTTTGTTTIPASATWFKIKWVYTSGTIELYIDGVLIDSEVGTFGANDGGYVMVNGSQTGAGTIDIALDYILLNYTLTR